MKLAQLTAERWQHLIRHAGAVDLRSREAFEAAHLPGCAHLPADDLEARLHELPPKGAPLILVGDQQALNKAQPWMTVRKYRIPLCVELEPQALWPVWAESGEPRHRLWQPNPFLEQHIAAIEASLGGPARALDLGAGSGREAVWLAQRGWRVLAVDNQANVLTRLQASACSWRVCVDVLQLDLRRQSSQVPEGAFHLVLMCRFLLRELFEPVRRWLRPGGYFLVETFTTGAAAFGKPKNPNFLLKDREIEGVFADWALIASERRHLPDGRPLAGELVRKPVH